MGNSISLKSLATSFTAMIENIPMVKQIRDQQEAYSVEGIHFIDSSNIRKLVLEKNLPLNDGTTTYKLGHNDSADAFKHAYENAVTAYKYGYNASSLVGVYHEFENINDYSPEEARMDMYNNEVGRRVGKEVWMEISSNLPLRASCTESQINTIANSIIKQRLLNSLLNGDLITTIDRRTDRRSADDLFVGDHYLSISGGFEAQKFGIKTGYYPLDGLSGTNIEFPDPFFPSPLNSFMDFYKNFMRGNPSLDNPILGSLMGIIATLFGQGTKQIDPLVLDLDGDGVETTNLTNSTVHFDLDQNTIPEKTAWLSSDDGFLVIDKNNNGSVELFGNSDTIGFESLKEYDSNNDLLICSKVYQFNRRLKQCA